MIDGWSPGIGDPTAWGWFTVFNYFVSAIMCIYASRNDQNYSRFWTAMAIFMLALCVNKQLDIQSLFTAIGREISVKGGWYNNRRVFQKEFIYALILLSTLFTISIAVILRKSSRYVIGSSIGLTILISFIVARASSFNYIDSALGLRFFAITLNHYAENLGIMIILINAGFAARKRAKA